MTSSSGGSASQLDSESQEELKEQPQAWGGRRPAGQLAWVAGGLQALHSKGCEFAAAARLSMGGSSKQQEDADPFQLPRTQQHAHRLSVTAAQDEARRSGRGTGGGEPALAAAARMHWAVSALQVHAATAHKMCVYVLIAACIQASTTRACRGPASRR